MGGLDAKADKWDVLGMLASMCWSIWQARNDWVFKKLRMEEVRISDRWSSYRFPIMNIAQSVDVVINGEEDQMEGDTQGWMPSSRNEIRVNIDGAYDRNTRKGGVGFVMQNNQGNAMRMHSIPIVRAQSAEMVEAMGFRMAAEVLRSCEGSSFILEGDAQRIVRMLQGSLSYRANLELIIHNTTIFFHFVSFNFIPRKYNRAMH